MNMQGKQILTLHARKQFRRVGAIATVDVRKMRSWVVATPNIRLSEFYTASIIGSSGIEI